MHSPPVTTVDNLVLGTWRAIRGISRGRPNVVVSRNGPAPSLAHQRYAMGVGIWHCAYFRMAPRLALRADLQDTWSSVDGVPDGTFFSTVGLSVALRCKEQR